MEVDDDGTVNGLAASAGARANPSECPSRPSSEARERQSTVLFADVSGSTRLYETAGDVAAHEAISGCLAVLRRATESSGGRVLKTIGDEILAVFPEPDAAAAAALEMQAATAMLPPVAGTPIGVRIGFHAGPVLQKDNDVFGDTVNLAARLVGQARSGQILTSRQSAVQLSPLLRSTMRQLQGVQLRGKAEEVGLCELIWDRGEDETLLGVERPALRAKQSVLRLVYGGKAVVRRREQESEILGRDPGCAIVIADPMASRRHCTIERRQDKWVLRDHSTNGTYVTLDGDRELELHREELTLVKHGWIAFGQTRARTSEVVEFFID